jgi:D-arabinose 5-phosphate isomerase GutQ
MGSGTVRSSASVNALKQLSTMKKVDDAVQTLAGSGRTRNLRSKGRHIRLNIKVVAMNPTMQTAIVKLSNFFCQAPKASRRYRMMTTALRLNIIAILWSVRHRI